jgi:PIN domain nuclease of toxin-antitoxin system
LRLLLDTHVALWALVDDPALPPAIRGMIADQANSITVSVASVWEITIKRALARGRTGDMPLSASRAVRYFGEAGFATLNITAEHAAAVEDLPRLHGDPFDRLLIAQALIEPLRLLTHDAQLAAYGDMVLLF